MSISIILILYQLLQHPAGAATPQGTVLSGGEDLFYEVSWSHIKIGSIHLQTQPVYQKNNSIRYPVKATIDSYSVPFVKLHFISCTEMDSLWCSTRAWSFEKKDEQWETMVYEYQPDRHCILASKKMQSYIESQPAVSSAPDTLYVAHFPVQDGISMLYYARQLTHQTAYRSLPVVAMGKVGTVEFFSEREKLFVEIDALNQPIRTVKLSGMLHIEGIMGLSGAFTGWFSDDAAAVPISAKLKVILGSIHIELKQWNSTIWQPPVKGK